MVLAVDPTLPIFRSGHWYVETRLTNIVSLRRPDPGGVQREKSKLCGRSGEGVQSAMRLGCADESLG